MKGNANWPVLKSEMRASDLGSWPCDLGSLHCNFFKLSNKVFKATETASFSVEGQMANISGFPQPKFSLYST